VGHADPPATLTIPISGMVQPAFAVYFGAGSGELPTADAAAGALDQWASAHIPSPLREAVAAFRKAGLLSIGVRPAAQLPLPPIELLQHMGLGELEERIARSATHVVLVVAKDLNMPPRAGLWAALAGALAVRDLVQGVIFDPESLRIIKAEEGAGWFSPNGVVRVAEHIIVPFSIGDRGLGWMTTRGLGKFALPDLELRDLPPNLDKLSIFMNAVAQYLVEAAFREVAARKANIDRLELPAEVSIDRALVARALRQKDDNASTDDGRVTAVLRFDSDPSTSGPPMIRIERPPSFAGDTGVWLNHVAGELLGKSHKTLMAKTEGDSMQRAHDRALSELPQIKQRFVAGLKPGEALFIKHGFPTTTGSREYLWAVVNRWQGTSLTVQVANDPHQVEGLRMGMTVLLEEADVFDWLIQLPGDRTEGGYTSKVALDEGYEGTPE
jgi:uncharacterized protein YegJ (DUF2314 family)